MNFKVLLLFGALCLPSVLVPVRVWAHGGPPRLVLNQSQVYPGAALEVRGENLVPNATASLSLIHMGEAYPLGTAESDEDGDFSQVFTLPNPLATGTYVILAIAEDLQVKSAPLTVLPAPAFSQEPDMDLRDRSEPLLAPLSPGRVDPASPPISESPLPDPAPTDLSLDWPTPLLIISPLLVFGLILTAMKFRPGKDSHELETR